ncbi:MAG TPA: phosphomannose isomerase type II C-terminal cupin domain [Spirochaetota bacterium]|nr:phosphomannose isomerase type II C-terminal cupin domain [Spirochaetota bacterium]
MDNNNCTRPWGFFENLDERDDHKLKRITVYPGKRLSLQRHRRRSEHWYVVQGTGIIRLGNEDVAVCPGVSVDIQCGVLHRMENTGSQDLIYIEVQTGDYFGEDDIERIEDDYGRV